MTEDKVNQAVIDKYKIIEVSTISRWSRDSGDSTGMLECFHPDAQVETSWFSGSREEWARQSGEMMAGHHPKDVQRHIMGNPHVTLRGDRAICEYTINIEYDKFDFFCDFKKFFFRDVPHFSLFQHRFHYM